MSAMRVRLFPARFNSSSSAGLPSVGWEAVTPTVGEASGEGASTGKASSSVDVKSGSPHSEQRALNGDTHGHVAFAEKFDPHRGHDQVRKP